MEDIFSLPFSLLYVSGSTLNIARFAIPSAVCDLSHIAIQGREKKSSTFTYSTI